MCDRVEWKHLPRAPVPYTRAGLRDRSALAYLAAATIFMDLVIFWMFFTALSRMVTGIDRCRRVRLSVSQTLSTISQSWFKTIACTSSTRQNINSKSISQRLHKSILTITAFVPFSLLHNGVFYKVLTVLQGSHGPDLPTVRKRFIQRFSIVLFAINSAKLSENQLCRVFRCILLFHVYA